MGKSTVQERFAIAPAPKIERSVFDRSHCHKTTFDSGQIIPIYVDEALPGDTFTARMTLFARLSTALQKPIMDNVYMDVHFFSIPNRLVWDHWKEFCGEVTRDNWDYEGDFGPGLSSTEYFIPTIDPGNSDHWFEPGGLADHFGLPTDQTFTFTYGTMPKISALPFRAYTLVWNEWYRDENMQMPVEVYKGDANQPCTGYPIQRRNRRKDYFTSCLPWPQKGDAVQIPIAGSAYVFGTGTALGLSDNVGLFGLGSELSGGITALEADAALFGQGTGSTGSGTFGATGGVGVIRKDESVVDGDSGLYADLSEATAITVNELRQVVQLRRCWKEMLGGTRYAEIIISHFGVVHPLHAVLQRPEFLGGGTIRFITNPVMQTSESGTTPQGNLAAYSVGSGSVGFNKTFMEHCIIIGLASVRADNTYQQGINRMWLRQTREEFYWPPFAHLGEQPVYRQEIWSNGNPVSDMTVFGYQERYAEYRYYPSMVTGQFRSTDSTPIDNWHLAMDFGILVAPTLSTLIPENPPIQRVVAVQSPAPEIMLDSYIRLKCARPMPMYSVPGLMDHF